MKSVNLVGLNFYCKDTKNISDIQNFSSIFLPKFRKNHVVFMTVWIETTAPARTKTEHENARKIGDFATFLHSLAVKTSKKAFCKQSQK